MVYLLAAFYLKIFTKSVARKQLFEELVEFPASLLEKFQGKRFNPFVYTMS